MENFVTIRTFSYPIEFAILRGRLESEGIECHILDELTVQVNPFYSNAIGGIKLQVKESDVQRAIEILKEGGYLKNENFQPSKSLTKLNKLTSKIPFLKKNWLIILIVIIVLLALIITGIIYYTTLPSTSERLTKQSWCVDHVIYNEEAYATNTVEQFQLVMEGYCEEKITMNTYGTIRLPGFNSRAVWGKWRLDNNTLHISEVDSFDFVYNGFMK